MFHSSCPQALSLYSAQPSTDPASNSLVSGRVPHSIKGTLQRGCKGRNHTLLAGFRSHNNKSKAVYCFFFFFKEPSSHPRSYPRGSWVKNPPASAGDEGDASSIPRWGRSPGEGHGNPLPYSCLGNPMDRGAWRATVHGVAKSQTRWVRTSHAPTSPLGHGTPVSLPTRKMADCPLMMVA